MSEDPGELERFYAETIEPLSAYDEQYETELVATVEAYLDNDGNVAATAKQLFTHRHTIRYRLERVRELCGHDVSSTEGREKLGLGLKAMRVLGIASPRGPALEPRRRGRQGPPQLRRVGRPGERVGRRRATTLDILGESANGKPRAFGARYPGSSPGSPVRRSVCFLCERMFVAGRGPRFTEDEARKAIAESSSLTETLRKLELLPDGRQSQDVEEVRPDVGNLHRPFRSVRRCHGPGSEAQETTCRGISRALDVLTEQSQEAPL